VSERLLRLQSEADSKLICRLAGRLVEDPNLRGWAFFAPGALDGHDEHVLRGALQRSRVLVLTGPGGVALLGDLFTLYSAGRELAVLANPRLSGLGARLQQAAQHADSRPAPLAIGARTFDWSRPVVMGVVNITPDSFSDGGQFLDPQAAIEHGLALVAAGADVLDLGGESTRPRGRTYGEGAQTVPDDEEIARVEPVVRGLRARTDTPLSVDTRKAAVARAALRAGADMINDVTGLLHDAALGAEVARTGAALCLMHVPADIEALSHEQASDDPVGDVLAGLREALARAAAAGVDSSRILLDPGLGFGKTPAANYLLIRHLECLVALGRPVLVGASRKASFARAAVAPGEPPPPVAERLPASLAAAVAALLAGAHVLRVHDVRETVQALRVAAAIAES
jgi:dihydropteroate synthase